MLGDSRMMVFSKRRSILKRVRSNPLGNRRELEKISTSVDEVNIDRRHRYR